MVWWVQLVLSSGLVLYILLSLYRFMRDPNSLADAFTPRWVQRIHNRRIMRRMREEYLRTRTPGSTDH